MNGLGLLTDRPVLLAGTPADLERNRASHAWTESGDCARCQAKPAHTAADYPCGTLVPREVYSPKLGRALTPAEIAEHWDPMP